MPIVLEAIIGLVTAFDIKADVLVSLALIASVCIGEIFAAGEVAFIMQLGGLLEELTVAKARAGIEKLVHLTPQTARVLAPDGTETIVPAEQVQVGDTLCVLPGESVPVDGRVLRGESAVDDMFSGEMNLMKNPSMAPYAKECDCLLQVTAKAKSEAAAEEMLHAPPQEAMPREARPNQIRTNSMTLTRRASI